MKKTMVALMLAITISGISALAQGGGGGFQQRPVEERVKNVLEKLAPLNLDKSQSDKTDTIFTEYYKAMDKAIADMRASGSFDREAMTKKREELGDARDEKLKKLWTADQFKKFKDEIEATLRPGRPPGSGGGGRNR